MYDFIGFPIYLGADNEGIIHGIDIISDKLKDINITKISIEYKAEYNFDKKFKYVNSINHNLVNLKNHLENLNHPVVIGGDHSLAVATLSSFINKYQDGGIVWIDAHADINTIETSPSGNIHGMSLAVATGLEEKILTNFFNEKKLGFDRILMLGLRDLDPGELMALNKYNVEYYLYQDLETMSLEEINTIIYNFSNRFKNIHLSFDLDSINPIEAPGVSTPVNHGFTSTIAMDLFKNIINMKKTRSVDIVEYNPINDFENKTLKLVENFIDIINKTD